MTKNEKIWVGVGGGVAALVIGYLLWPKASANASNSPPPQNQPSQVPPASAVGSSPANPVMMTLVTPAPTGALGTFVSITVPLGKYVRFTDAAANGWTLAVPFSVPSLLTATSTPATFFAGTGGVTALHATGGGTDAVVPVVVA